MKTQLIQEAEEVFYGRAEYERTRDGLQQKNPTLVTDFFASLMTKIENEAAGVRDPAMRAELARIKATVITDAADLGD